jgi:hypothetical protein
MVEVKDREIILERLRKEADGSFSIIYRALANVRRAYGSPMKVEAVVREIHRIAFVVESFSFLAR